MERRRIAPEAASGAQGTAGGAFGYADSWQRVMQSTWTSPVTSRLLLEAGASTYISKWGWMEQPGAILNLNQVQEQNSINGMPANLTYRALDNNFNAMQNPTTWRACAVLRHRRAQHEVRVRRGLQQIRPVRPLQQHPRELPRGQHLSWYCGRCRVHFGLPRLHHRSQPGDDEHRRLDGKDRSQYHGFYMQDQSTFSRLTLQGALRYDRAWSWSTDDQGATGTDRFRPAPISFPRDRRCSRLQRHHRPRWCCLRCLWNGQDLVEGQHRQVPREREQPEPLHADESGPEHALSRARRPGRGTIAADSVSMVTSFRNAI